MSFSIRYDDRGVREILDVKLYEARYPHLTKNIATCCTCGRSWDDHVPTSATPAPGGRCPFEYDHKRTTCADRIESELAERAEDARQVLAAHRGAKTVCPECGSADTTALYAPDADTCNVACDGCDHEWRAEDEPNEYDEDSIYDYGLSITRKVVIRWDFSTGGPGDWIEILCDPEDRYTVERVTYHFNDWFDHATQEVDKGSPLWDLAEWCAELQAEMSA